MNENDCERGFSVGLPMTSAQDGNSRLNLDEPVFWFVHRKSSLQKETGHGLHVPTAKKSARAEN
jgi:hypothetical protein